MMRAQLDVPMNVGCAIGVAPIVARGGERGRYAEAPWSQYRRL